MLFKTIVDQDIPLAEDVRLVKRLEKTKKSDNFPKGIKFSFQYLIFKDNEWQQLVRIDNYIHQGKKGVHIHLFKRKNVKFEDIIKIHRKL